jgi:protein tyrosine phosphatase (PTP) superfamily phosphohydrolase (DUF442 family)
VAQGIPPGDLQPQVHLSAPETTQPPLAALQPQAGVAEERGNGTPPVATPPLPVGIPQFAQVRKRVATGLRPILDGLDYLANNGYRTVLHLRPPGQDDTADKKQFQQRGLQYFSLEVSPDTLRRDLVDQFNHLVADPGMLPLFVYDRDGSLAGGLWYLHFRTVEGASDEDARARAARFGLKENTPEGRLMWLAVQKYLSDQNR